MKILIFTVILLGAGYLFAKSSKGIKVSELNEMINQKDLFKGIVIDVRTPKEVESGIIKGAIVKDAYSKDIKSFVKSLDPSKEYYVYCQAGVRSLAIVKLMKKHKITGINISGGISAWKKAQYPVVDVSLNSVK